MRAQLYELRVRGPVSDELLREIGALEVVEEVPLTILRTDATDQSGLHGMLQRLESLGLELVEVRTVPEPPLVDENHGGDAPGGRVP